MRFDVRTSQREQMLDVTSLLTEALLQSRVQSGVVVAYVPHTTAGVTVNENADPSVVRDILDGLRTLVPRDGGWRHAEGNADAHVKASLMGSSVTIPVRDGALELGTWQGVYFCEFDGPRSRQLAVRVIGE